MGKLFPQSASCTAASEWQTPTARTLTRTWSRQEDDEYRIYDQEGGSGRHRQLSYRLGDTSYLSGFGQLELNSFEGEWRAFRFEDGDLIVFGQLKRHVEQVFQ
jgi:hypothetical protein